MDERFHYGCQIAVVGKHHLGNCWIAYGAPPPDNNIACGHRGGFFDNINIEVDEKKEHIFEGNPRWGLVQMEDKEIRNVVSLSRLSNPDPAQPSGASQGRKRDADGGVSQSRVRSGNMILDAPGMVDQFGRLPNADRLLQCSKVENCLDSASEKYRTEVSMHPSQKESKPSLLNFQQHDQVVSSRSTSVAKDLEEVQIVKKPKPESKNLEVKTTDLSNLLDDLSEDTDVDGLGVCHNVTDHENIWSTLLGIPAMRPDERSSIEGLPGPCEIQVKDTNVDPVGNANCVALELQVGNTYLAPMDYPKDEVICLDSDCDDDDMAMCDWRVDDSHFKLAKLEIENDSNLMHTDMDAEESEEEIPVVSSITASGTFMHAKPPVASSPADVSSPGNLAAPPPGSRVNLEGMNVRAGTPLPVKSLSDQVQLLRTTYGHGVSGPGPTVCRTLQHAKPSSADIHSHGNPRGCFPGPGLVLQGENGLNVTVPPLHAQIPIEQVHLSRAASGYGVSDSSEPGPSNVNNCRPHSKTPNRSVCRFAGNHKTKKISKIKQWRREHMQEQQRKRRSVEELKRLESAGKLQRSPTTKGTVGHTIHSSPSTPSPLSLGTSKTQAGPDQGKAKRSKCALVPSQSGPASSRPLFQERKYGANVHQIGVAKVESVRQGHKNFGSVKNQTNTSRVKNIGPVNRESNNQLSLVKPVFDTTISTPRDAVTQTLESYDYYFRVASLKLQEDRWEQAQQGRGPGHSPCCSSSQVQGTGCSPCHSPAQVRGTGPSPEPVSHRPDIQAYNAVRNAQEDVHRQMVVGDVPGVEIGDRYKFRHQMAVVGLHHLPNCGIAYGSPPPDNISLASAVVCVPTGGYADNVDNGHEVIYTGQGGRADRNQGAPFVEHQKAEKGNKALLMNIDQDVPVRMIRAHINLKNSSNTKTLGYTYDGLYRVESFKYELGVGGYNVYKFFLRRLDHQPPIPPCIEGCTAHPWNDGQGAFIPFPLQVVAPEYEVQQILGVAEDNDSEDGI